MAPRRLAWMTGLVAVLVATSAYSQHRESGDVYMGAALGYHVESEAEEAESRLQSRFESASIDDGAIGWSVYGGFAVADGLALELGYLGNIDMEIAVRATADAATVKADWSTSAFYAAVVGHFPMPRGSAAYPFLKAGIARWDTDASLKVGGQSVSVADDSGTHPLFGVGVDVLGFRNLAVRGEYMLLWLDVGDGEGGHHHRFQAGVNFTF